MATDARTREYVAKHTEDGLSKKEIFRVMKNPKPAALTNDLRPLRLSLGLTQVAVASALRFWPTAISRIEHGKSRDREAISSYRTWLEKQAREGN